MDSPWAHAGAVLWQLTLRELRVRYKQSILGVGWALFVPLALLLTLHTVFSRWTGLTDDWPLGMPYPEFVALGIVPWLFLTQSLTQAAQSLVANRSLVTKIYFRREVFPLSNVLCALVDALLSVPILIALVWWYHESVPAPPHAASIPLRAILLAAVCTIQLTLTVGLALWLSLANLFYRDIKLLLPLVLQLWMFTSNVMYPLPSESALGAWAYLNPMIPILTAYRSLVALGQAPDAATLWPAAALALGIASSGWACFRLTEPRFAENV